MQFEISKPEIMNWNKHLEKEHICYLFTHLSSSKLPSDQVGCQHVPAPNETDLVIPLESTLNKPNNELITVI